MLKISKAPSPEIRPFKPCGPVSRYAATAISLLMFAASSPLVHAVTPLADVPLFSNPSVPGNLALALSVEWPTVVRAAHISEYASRTTYLGYFDPNKCYLYTHVEKESSNELSHFYPVGRSATGAGTPPAELHTCSGQWSGNFLNWAATQTIDPFRWALTGGYRVIDLPDRTILEKAPHSGQGDLYPDKSVNATVAAAATPFSGSTFRSRITSLDNRMRFRLGSNNFEAKEAKVQPFTGGAIKTGVTYEVRVRVKVCDPTPSAGGVESNCVRYGSNWKPEGLIQKYSKQMRFSAFGYLNDSDPLRDGGVLRARQKFVAPTHPVPLRQDVSNARREWDADTGVFTLNPDPEDAKTTQTLFGGNVPISNSGVINYVNKFGQIVPGDFKSKDPVSELYYAALRYFKNQGNVPSYTNIPTNTDDKLKRQWADGFPVITNWDDPIQFRCQRNFILGIGDIYTHVDKNLPGSVTGSTGEPKKPNEVSGDETNSVEWTTRAFALQGLKAPDINRYDGSDRNNSAGMVGLAYYANTTDIRPDLSNTPGSIGQTVKTYWVDVLENPFVTNNQFYLTAKYGGFNVPASYNPLTNTAPLSDSLWTRHTAATPDLVGSQPRPSNYYTAGRPDQMVAGLTEAFANIAAQLKSFTTSFSTALPQLTLTGNASFSAQYDPDSWTGELMASELIFKDDGSVSTEVRWNFTDKLATQLAGTGWSSATGRRVVTWNTQSGAGAPFRYASLSTGQRAALDTPYRAGDDGSDYLDYLRGSRTNEQATIQDASKPYRFRAKLLGDIVGSKSRAVGPPNSTFANASNPGYSTFKTTWASRPSVVYVGANDGMLHAVNGALTTAADVNSGREIFAYIPGALYQGPDGTPSVTGLASLGNPDFTHKFKVNATPQVFDIDFARTPGGSGTPNWKSVLIGGLGKGGRAYYAIDVTDPASMMSGTESAMASKVLWEFSHPKLGYTFGEPVIVKTRQHGWVMVLVSGYNNSDGQGYFFVVNPRTGDLLQDPIPTGVGTPANDAGLAFANGYVLDRTDGTADAVYAGDLDGNVWRLDITPLTGNFAPPTRIATLTDAGGAAQPVTTRPLIEVDPQTKRRFVLLGTGRLLDESDISSSQIQTYYFIVDGDAGRFNLPSNLPTGVKFPISRDKLFEGTPAMLTTVAGVPWNPTTQIGWRLDLGLGPASKPDVGPPTVPLAYRVIGDSSPFYGSVAFASLLPNGDECSPAGSSRVYVVNFNGGTSRLLENPSNQTKVPFVVVTGAVNDVAQVGVSSPSGGAATSRTLVGSNDGGVSSLNTVPPASAGLRRLNWRELSLAN